VQQFESRCTNPTIQKVVVARLKADGFLDAETEKDATQINELADKEEAKQQTRQKKEAEEKRISENKPDMKLYRLWNERNGNPTALFEYIAKTPTTELIDYLKSLKANPTHFASLFNEGIFDVIAKFDLLIAEKLASEETKQTKATPKPLSYST
jgi:hypothetical protein